MPDVLLRPGKTFEPFLGETKEKEFLIGNLLERIHFVIEMIWWTGLAPWEFESPFQAALHLPS